MFAFNRFYLIVSLLLSFLIPTITTSTKVIETIPVAVSSEFHVKTVTSEATSSWGHSDLFLVFYVVVTLVFFVNFSRGLWKVFTKIVNGERHKKEGYTLVLTSKNEEPQTFFKYVILNKELYQSNNFDETILLHEAAHAQQLHSLDILFVELLKVIFWFNPVTHLYSKSLRENHEYLADDFVIRETADIASYQQLLLQTITQHSTGNQLTSRLAYTSTKNRFIMMTKHTTKKRIFFKTGTSLAVLTFSFFIFGKTVIAQSGANPEEVEQYVEIVLDNFDQDGKPINLSEADEHTMRVIYGKMDKGQKEIMDGLSMPCPAAIHHDGQNPPPPPPPPAPPAPPSSKDIKANIAPPPPPLFPPDARYFIDGKEVTHQEANIMLLNYKYYDVELKKGNGAKKTEFHINKKK